MTSVLRTRAIALEIRTSNPDAAVGMGLLVPSHRYGSFLAKGASDAIVGNLSNDMWHTIEDWIAASDAALPMKPAPLNPWIVQSFVGGTEAVTGGRLASIPFALESLESLTSQVDSIVRVLGDFTGQHT